MFLLNGLRQFSQQIPWQKNFCPAAGLSFERVAHRRATIRYLCVCGIATLSVNKGWIPKK